MGMNDFQMLVYTIGCGLILFVLPVGYVIWEDLRNKNSK